MAARVYNIGIVSKGVCYDMGNRTKDLRLLGRCHVDGHALPAHGVLKSLTIPRT